ncbi:MAG TPA: FixH family protein [Devosia sp.]|nr:FixH family protein [Devosia sp.]
MSSAQRKPAQEFTGFHMWVLVISFFGVIIAVNVGMAVLATTSWTGLVVQNSYVASQEFEEKRLAHEAQRTAGWRSAFEYTPGTARLRIVDGADLPVDLGEATLMLNRPVGGHDDKKLTLVRTHSGHYEAAAELLPGVWEVTISAPETPLGVYELRERIRVEGTP